MGRGKMVFFSPSFSLVLILHFKKKNLPRLGTQPTQNTGARSSACVSRTNPCLRNTASTSRSTATTTVTTAPTRRAFFFFFFQGRLGKTGSDRDDLSRPPSPPPPPLLPPVFLSFHFSCATLSFHSSSHISYCIFCAAFFPFKKTQV